MIKRALYVLAAAALAWGCYADKGNYDFNLDNMNYFGDIEISPKPSQRNDEQFSYTVKFPQPPGGDSVCYTLKVRVKQTVNDDKPENLKYVWDRSYYNAQQQRVNDTVETDGDLDIWFHPFTNLDHMGWSLWLKVVDTSTTLEQYYKFTIKPRVTFENSLFVLHGNNADEHKLGNICFVEDHMEIVKDVEDIVVPDTVERPHWFGKTTHLAGASSLRNMDTPWAGLYMWTDDFNGDVTLFNPYKIGSGPLTDYDQTVMLPTNAKVANADFIPRWVSQPYNVFSDPRLLMVDTSGHLLLSSISGIPSRDNDWLSIKALMLYIPAYCTAYTPDGREIPESEYEFVQAAEDRNGGDQGLIVGYDRKGKRFLYVTVSSFTQNSNTPVPYRTDLDTTLAKDPVQNAFIDYSVLSEEQQLTTNDKELLFLHGGSISDPGGIYAYFIDNSKRVYRYQLTYCGLGGKQPATRVIDTSPVYKIECSQMVNMTDVTKDTPFVYWPIAAPSLVYYADGGTLYRYNSQSHLRTPVYEAPAGWTINKLKVKVISSNGQTYEYRDSENNFAYNQICIGMHKGDEGAVAEIQLLPNGALDESYTPRFYDGFEHVHDFYFAYTYQTYEMTDE